MTPLAEELHDQTIQERELDADIPEHASFTKRLTLRPDDFLPSSVFLHKLVTHSCRRDIESARSAHSSPISLSSDSDQIDTLYTPLPIAPSFRLVVLMPDNRDDTIVCKLSSILRDDANEEYEALSYTWCDFDDLPLRIQKVVCNGYWVEIGENLFFHSLLDVHRVIHRGLVYCGQINCVSTKRTRRNEMPRLLP